MTDVQKLWLKNLRAGWYLQSENPYALLMPNDGYSALGVACELAYRHGIIDNYIVTDPMPHSVYEWLGIKFPWSAPFPLDDNSISFAEYADRIEQNAHLVFKE